MTSFHVDGSAGEKGVPKNASDLLFWEDVLNDKPGPLADIIPAKELEEGQKGGPGSGFRRHGGRPGKRGGSASSKVSILSDVIKMQSDMFPVKTFADINKFFVAEVAKQHGFQSSDALALSEEFAKNQSRWRGIADRVSSNIVSGRDNTKLRKESSDIEALWGFEGSKELEVLETSKSVFRLTYEEGQKDTTSIFDKIKMLPPKERAEVRKRARDMAEVLSAKDRLAVLLNLPDEEWEAAVAADELEEQMN